MGLDPNYLYDNADVIWYGTEGYSNALNALMQVSGKSETAVEMMLNAKYGAADYWTAVEALKDKGVVAAYNTNGYRCFAYSSDVSMTAPSSPISSIDSNATSTTMVKASPVYDVVVDDVPTSETYGKVLTNPVGNMLTPEHGFYGWKFFAGEAIQAIGAAGTGISLGKTFDRTLYNAFPDFFDSHGMWSLNPATWASITNGDDSFAAGLFNMVFGIDPNTGNGQAFIDESAFAYIAQYLKSAGVFDAGTPTVTPPEDFPYDNFPEPLYITDVPVGMDVPVGLSATNIIKANVRSGSEPYRITFYPYSNSRVAYVISTLSGGGVYYIHGVPDGPSAVGGIGSDPYTRDGKSVYYAGNDMRVFTPFSESSPNLKNWSAGLVAWVMQYGTVHQPSTIDGIGDQSGATLPDTSDWNDDASTLQSLKDQYPELWDNAVPNTIVQPDGSTKTIVYVPIAMPNANGQWDTQPTSSTTSQADPQVQPQTQPTPQNNDLLKLLLQQITMPQPNPETEPQTQTQPQPNIPTPTTTGTGDTPTPVPPVGNASALWSVYHPTQAQVNDFGAWLWTDNIIQRIQQVLQNPMEGIITLHKVFGMPVDSGQGTIVVGRLNSQVPSATVTQQYITVDCGSVDCSEEFGTVFDYPPYTEISLYLPFIGIVPLNVNDIMRSQIHITYGIDVFTGACLAMVEVTRDANVVNMYQYSGVASVEYPLTGTIHTGLISGLLGAAGSIAVLATGGTATPVVGVLGAAGSAISSGKQSQARAGGFSGNAGAMGIKNPYLIIERPQVKTAETFPNLAGFPTNYSVKLGDCEGHVVVSHVHVEGINATQSELIEIENLLQSGVLV